MPFTPFHVGPSLLVGVPARRYLDLPTFVAANLVVDVRATLVFFGLLDGPLHGPLHTYAGATVVAGVLAAAAVAVHRRWPDLVAEVSATPGNALAVALAALLGTWLHVSLDAVLYTDVSPLWPLAGNPLLGLTGPFVVYAGCVLSGVVGALYGAFVLVRGPIFGST